MVRSCSIPESLACEWEADSNLYQTSSCRLFTSLDSSDYRLGAALSTPPDRIQNSPILARNCRTDFCAVKVGTLKSELEVAQAQIRILENQLVDHGIDIR